MQKAVFNKHQLKKGRVNVAKDTKILNLFTRIKNLILQKRKNYVIIYNISATKNRCAKKLYI